MASQIDFGLENNNDEKEQLSKAIQRIEKALANIDILFEEGEIDLPTYRQRKTGRQNELLELKKQSALLVSNTEKLIQLN